MAKEVSDFANISFFEVMEKPAVEILGILVLMNAKNEFMK
jgi:hypothetical protein